MNRGGGHNGNRLPAPRAYLRGISAAFASLIWATPLHARYLQVDPVGYDDQINLYAYVGNDPVNGIDPTGTTCTSSQVNGRTVYACRIDRIMRNGREVSCTSLTRNHQRQIRNFERRYTNAVNALMAQNRRVTVGETAGQAGSSFEATSRELGRVLLLASSIMSQIRLGVMR